MQTTFHGLEFLTAPGRVFTPRATTEALVDAALELIEGRAVRVADVGTGSGAIAITLALETGASVAGTDVSFAALRIAAENARRLGAKVDWVGT